MAIKQKVSLADTLGVSEEELRPEALEGTDAIEIDIDFEAGGTQDYPSGTYHSVLEAVEKKVAGTGNPMLVWRFRTLRDKRAFWLNTVLTRDAMWKVTETAVACGAKGEGQVRIDVSSLIGNCCRLVIEQNIYEGQSRPSVKKVLAPTQETQDIYELG
jgi:hypothetical protein